MCLLVAMQEEINQLKLHNVSAMPRLESEHHNLSAMSPNPGYSSNNLLHKVTIGIFESKIFYGSYSKLIQCFILKVLDAYLSNVWLCL